MIGRRMGRWKEGMMGGNKRKKLDFIIKAMSTLV